MNIIKTCVAIGTLLCASHPARAQQAHVNLDWNPHKNVQNLNPYGANVISPEVRDDRTITFRLRAPDARTVALTGGPILLAVGKGNTPIPFEKGADGVWILTVGPLKPNLYIYRLMVDGVAVVDPNNTFTGFSDQPGYSTVVVHGDGPAYYDAKPVPHGTVTRHVYRSNVLNGEREMDVYTPPNYDRNRRLRGEDRRWNARPLTISTRNCSFCSTPTCTARSTAAAFWTRPPSTRSAA